MIILYFSIALIVLIIIAFAISYKKRSKKHHASIDDTLFSLPTISSDIGKCKPATVSENVYVIHEDDWRQNEFVSHKFQSEIKQEIDAISEIYKNFRKSMGFKKLHVREKIPNPLKESHINPGLVKKYFDIVKEYDGVTYHPYDKVVKSGFAWETREVGVLWGQIDEQGDILCLCLDKANAAWDDDAYLRKVLEKLLSQNNLYYIEWCRMNVIGPEN